MRTRVKSILLTSLLLVSAWARAQHSSSVHLQDFDGSISGWTQTDDCYTGKGWHQSTVVKYGLGKYSMGFNLTDGYTNCNATAFSPVLTASGVGQDDTFEFSFLMYRQSNSGKGTLGFVVYDQNYSVKATSAAYPINYNTTPSESSAGWYQYKLRVPASAFGSGSTKKFAYGFKASYGANTNNAEIYTDNVAVYRLWTTKSLTLSSPNGGEKLKQGNNYDIKWAATNISGVKLEYSTDNGTNWNTIASVATDRSLLSGSYTWDVPKVVSDNCLIRITDLANASFTDVSDAVFSIVETPTLELVSPKGGESWTSGNTYTIKWKAKGVANIKAEYTTDGSNWTVISNSIDAVADSTFDWVVPHTPTGNALVRITDVSDTTVKAVSAAIFTIIDGRKLTLLEPNGGESWQGNTSHDIKWTSEFVDMVKIEYSTDNGTKWQTVSASVSAPNGAYAWTTPNITSDKSLVRITSIDDATIKDVSDNTFELIDSRKLTFVNPAGDKTITGGSVFSITWTSKDIANVKIEYSPDNGGAWTTIIASTNAASGSYAWTVPSITSARVKLRLSDAADQKFSILSEGFITIVPASGNYLLVSSPNGGESYKVADIQEIRWLSNVQGQVKIEFTSNNGAAWKIIKASVPASDGKYNWVVPRAISTVCRIKVTSLQNASLTDATDGYFTIIEGTSPSLRIITPTSGDRLGINSPYNITWASAMVNQVKIEYSTDNVNWTTVTASTDAKTSSYVWTVPNAPSNTARVRISDVSNPSQNDVSEEFTVVDLTGMTENVYGSALQVQPNPFSTQLTLSFSLKPSTGASLYITDITGRIYFGEDNITTDNSGRLTVRTETWPAGIYLARLTSPGINTTVKVILQR